MNITRENYEPFFLDFQEGNLKEDQIDEFLDFLEQNPDLKEELYLFENLRLPEDRIVFAEKQKLYKSEADEKTKQEHQLIAFLEGDLTVDRQKSFETELSSHPELQKEYQLLTKTRLVPDAGIKFPDKQKLYRKSGTIHLMNWIARAAAVVVLLWGINSLFQTQNKNQTPNPASEIGALKQKPELPVIKPETGKLTQVTDIQEKLIALNESRPANAKSIRKKIILQPEEKQSLIAEASERDSIVLFEIAPIFAQLEVETDRTQMVVAYPVNVSKINDHRNVMSIREFLASRLKKAGDRGLISAEQIARAGLGVAAELSGDRIGFGVKDGKITSLEFESRLLAFSIPLKKE